MSAEHVCLFLAGIAYLFIAWWVIFNPTEEEEACEDRGYCEEGGKGGGIVGEYRAGPGWKTPEALQALDEWQAEAGRRVELAEHLTLNEIYGDRGEGEDDDLEPEPVWPRHAPSD